MVHLAFLMMLNLDTVIQVGQKIVTRANLFAVPQHQCPGYCTALSKRFNAPIPIGDTRQVKG